MNPFRPLFRYFAIALAIAGLAIGLNTCANPSATVPSTVPSTTPSVMESGGMSPGMSSSMSPGMSHGKKINLNTAILSELDKLEAKLGIPALSNQIQAARPYGSIEDLVSKKVLTQAQFDQIKDLLTVEDIALTGEAKDVDYLTKLGLMQGHMLVAKELLALNLPKQAEPHIGHPIEEIYVDIADQLPERNVPEFEQVLTKLQDLVRAKPTDLQVQPSFQAAVAAIDKAIAALPVEKRQNPKFVLQSVTELLETAVSEYTAAISNGKITEAIEYQDSRGFVTYAKEVLLPSIRSKMNVTLNQELTANFAKLSQAWPQTLPPAKPVLTVEQVATQVKAIEAVIVKA